MTIKQSSLSSKAGRVLLAFLLAGERLEGIAVLSIATGLPRKAVYEALAELKDVELPTKEAPSPVVVPQAPKVVDPPKPVDPMEAVKVLCKEADQTGTGREQCEAVMELWKLIYPAAPPLREDVAKNFVKIAGSASKVYEYTQHIPTSGVVVTYYRSYTETLLKKKAEEEAKKPAEPEPETEPDWVALAKIGKEAASGASFFQRYIKGATQ